MKALSFATLPLIFAFQNAPTAAQPANSVVDASAPTAESVVSFETQFSGPDENAGQVALTVRLSESLPSDLSVAYTVAGTAGPDDYSIAASPLVIPAGSTSGEIAVTLKQDDALEDVETVVITLSQPAGAALGEIPQHSLKIVDLGGPLVVNGTTISPLSIKRCLAYGPGRVSVESRKIQMFVDQERELRIAQGADPASMDVTPEEFKVVYDREIEKFRTRYPSLDLSIEIARAYKSVEFYEQQLRQTLQFDKMFFPGDPETWPELTKEAVHASSPQVDLVLDAKQSYDRRKEHAAETGEPMIPEDEMFMGLLRDYVIGQLGSLVTVKSAVDGLPEDLLIVVEAPAFRGELRTDELFAEIGESFTAQDITDARRFLATLRATEDRLKKDGAMLSEEEYTAIVDKLKADLAGSQSMFSLDFLSLQLHQFPSTESYLAHLRLMESYRKLMEPTTAEAPGGGLSPALMEHLPTANMVMGLSRADAEVMLLSAFDFPNYKWRENGWETAKQRADELRKQVDDHIDKLIAQEEARMAAAEKGENFAPENPVMPFDQYWAQLLDIHSEYWDPPMPVEGKMPPMQGMKMKGRFGRQTRNDLERYVGESYYSKFLRGDSVADVVFFEMDPGSVAGPLKGPHGYYLVWLKTRTSPTNPLRLNEPRHVEMLKEDFLRSNFTTYAHEALAQADVVGL